MSRVTGPIGILSILVASTANSIYQGKSSLKRASPTYGRRWLLWSNDFQILGHPITRVTLYTAGHLHTAVPHCSHSRAPIVHTAVPRENNEHGCVYLRCRAVCKLPGCVEGHPCITTLVISLPPCWWLNCGFSWCCQSCQWRWRWVTETFQWRCRWVTVTCRRQRRWVMAMLRLACQLQTETSVLVSGEFSL